MSPWLQFKTLFHSHVHIMTSYVTDSRDWDELSVKHNLGYNLPCPEIKSHMKELTSHQHLVPCNQCRKPVLLLYHWLRWKCDPSTNPWLSQLWLLNQFVKTLYLSYIIFETLFSTLRLKLTHWGQIAAILQMTFSNAFSGMKIFTWDFIKVCS